MTHRSRLFLRILQIIGGCFALVIAYFFLGLSRVDTQTKYGITWSAPYAESLGLDANEGLKTALDDLGVRLVRIPAYWNLIEPDRGRFDMDVLKKQLDLIALHGGKAIVVVGATAPRWPECWIPGWVSRLTTQEREQAQLNYVKHVFDAFVDHPALESWQVENEPLLTVFGACKDQRREFLENEITFVKRLELSKFPDDPHHRVITTDSGELSTWLGFAGLTQGKGISVYRSILTTWGVWTYDFLPPFFYARKAALVSWLTGPIFVSELQMEPWERVPLTVAPLSDQFRTFDITRMESNFSYAERLGFPRVYFWGAEWWLWMKEKMNHPEFWEMAKRFFGTHS